MNNKGRRKKSQYIDPTQKHNTTTQGNRFTQTQKQTLTNLPLCESR